MTLKQLYYFLKIAETRSFSEAARLLGISQPSLSYTIKQLEKEVPLPLFEKEEHGKRILLSESGKIFYDYVVDALDNLEQGRKAMEEYASRFPAAKELNS